jgi:hypothetical protein
MVNPLVFSYIDLTYSNTEHSITRYCKGVVKLDTLRETVSGILSGLAVINELY